VAKIAGSNIEPAYRQAGKEQGILKFEGEESSKYNDSSFSDF
jgi:hypothetical protein